MIIFHFHSKIDYCQLLLINIILMFKSTALSLKKKHSTFGCCTPKQRFIVMACNRKLHAIISWCEISIKLNIGKKITGLEIMTLNCKNI